MKIVLRFCLLSLFCLSCMSGCGEGPAEVDPAAVDGGIDTEELETNEPET